MLEAATRWHPRGTVTVACRVTAGAAFAPVSSRGTYLELWFSTISISFGRGFKKTKQVKYVKSVKDHLNRLHPDRQ